MPRDLFEEAGINPYDDSSPRREPRDLFAEAGINPYEDQPHGKLDKIANSSAVNALLGAGDSVSNMLRGAMNLAPGVNIPMAKTGEGTAYNIGNIGGDIGGFLAGGEALDAARGGAEAIPYIGKLAEALGGDGLSGVGRRAIGTGLYTGIENPDARTKGAAEGAALSVALDSLFGGAGKLINQNLFRGTATPEEIAKNLEISRGTNTNLAEVMKDPVWKKRFENVFPAFLGSNSYSVMGKVADQVKKQGQDLYNDMAQGIDKRNLKPAITDALKGSYKDAMNLKQQHFKYLDDLADSYGVKIHTPNFENTATDILNTMKESPLLMKRSGPLLAELNGYANRPVFNKGYSYPEPAEKTKSTNIFKGMLGDDAREAAMNGYRYKAGVYGALRNALEKDVQNSFESTGNPELMDKYKAAQNFYKENIVPFEDPEVEKFVTKGGDPDLILNTFIKKGQNDRANLLGKLMDKLPEDQKNLVPASYFSNTLKEGNIDPIAMKNLYNGLGEEQRETLLGPELNKRMGNYSKLVSMNSEPLASVTKMFNPNTGQRNAMLQALLFHGLGAGAGAIGGSHEGSAGTLFGSLVGMVAPGIYVSALNKLLTSPKFREYIANNAIKNSSPKSGLGIDKYRDSLKAALAASFVNQ